MQIKPAIRYPLIILAVIILDQASKLIVKLNMQKHEEIPLLGNFLKIHFIENPGAAFGMTMNDIFPVSDYVAKIILTVFSLIAVCAIGYMLKQVMYYKNALPVFLSLILGGALGNIIDRTFYGVWFDAINDYEGGLFFGHVVDMIYVDICNCYIPDWVPIWGGGYYQLWPVFNLADSFITIGVVCIMVFQYQLFKDPNQTQPTKTEESQTQPTPNETNLATSEFSLTDKSSLSASENDA